MPTYLTKAQILAEAEKLGGDASSYVTFGTFNFKSIRKAKEFRDWLAYNQQPARVVVGGNSRTKRVILE